MPADADQDPAPAEPAELLAEALGILQRVEAERSLDESRDLIRDQPRAGRDDQVVPLEARRRVRAAPCRRPDGSGRLGR